MNTEKTTFIGAMRRHVGQRPGQSLGDFAQEIRGLDANDRRYFTEQFNNMGVIIAPDTGPIIA